MTMYGLRGDTSGEVLMSKDGRYFIHDNAAEMEWLFVVQGGAKAVPLSRDFLENMPTVELKQHPEFSHMRFPIDKRDFR